MKKVRGDTLQTRLSRFLFSYRITPHATTGLSPAEVMMSRRLRSAFDLLMPEVKTKDQQRQLKQKENHDTKKRREVLHQFCRNYSYSPKRIPAVIVSSSGPVSYTGTIGNGQTRKQHVDQVTARFTDTVPSEPGIELEPLPDAETGSGGFLHSVMDITPQPPSCEQQESPLVPDTQTQPDSPVPPVVRRSRKERHLPVYLKDFVR